MKTINITVENDKIISISDRKIGAAGSYGTVELAFNLSEEWDEFSTIKCTFQNSKNETPVDSILDSNFACEVPSEALKYDGYTYFNLVGILGTDIKLKTVWDYLEVGKALEDGQSPIPPTPDQLIQHNESETAHSAILGLLTNLITPVKTTFEAAINWLFDYKVDKIDGKSLYSDEDVEAVIETQKNQPNGIAGLDEEGNVVLGSNIKASYQVAETGISEIEFASLDLSTDGGEYEVSYQLNPTVEVVGDNIGFAFNLASANVNFSTHAFIQGFEQIYDIGSSNNNYLCVSEPSFENPVNALYGSFKLKIINGVVIFSGYSYVKELDLLSSDPVRRTYLYAGYISDSNVTSIKAYCYTGDFDIGSKIEIRRVW